MMPRNRALVLDGTNELGKLLAFGIIPIVRTSDRRKAAKAAESLLNAGLGVLEISLSAEGSLEILEEMSDRFGDEMLLGAGTVLDARTARDAVSAGARFIVSPGIVDAVIDVCKQLSIVVCPGALTPTEIVRAWQSGADAIKVFPCDAAGGPQYIRSLSAPLPGVVLLPCGGVNLQNAAEYFAAGAAALFVGSSLIPVALSEKDLSEAAAKGASRFMQITRETRKARQ
jgi:2-dehydro-3-deoxyphosphogluconate aldolase / (4S)-4-hydroxy-2-oxoglutarate aldolase